MRTSTTFDNKNNPQAQVQIGNVKLSVLAEEATAQERERLWTDWIQENPAYRNAQARTSRKFPIILLKPTK